MRNESSLSLRAHGKHDVEDTVFCRFSPLAESCTPPLRTPISTRDSRKPERSFASSRPLTNDVFESLFQGQTWEPINLKIVQNRRTSYRQNLTAERRILPELADRNGASRSERTMIERRFRQGSRFDEKRGVVAFLGGFRRENRASASISCH